MAIATVSFAFSTIATASGDYDLFELTPVDDRPIEIVGFVIGVLEAGDAQDEYLQLSWVSDNATTGNGTLATPRPVNPRDTNVGFTAETVATTPASTGTPLTLEVCSIPARGGDRIWYPDKCGHRVDQADVMLCLRLTAAVADDVTMGGTVWVNEL